MIGSVVEYLFHKSRTAKNIHFINKMYLFFHFASIEIFLIVFCQNWSNKYINLNYLHFGSNIIVNS